MCLNDRSVCYLGRTTITVAFTIDQTARGYLNHVTTNEILCINRQFLWACSEQDPHETAIILEDLMLKAIEQIKLQMILSHLSCALSQQLARPHGKDIYQLFTKVVLSRLNKPNDVAVEWIAAALECEFLPKSSLHKLLRAWLINSTANQKLLLYHKES